MLITLDFETYFDKEFSLKKMPTASYVRDKRFKVLGAGVKVNDDPAKFFRGKDLESFLSNIESSQELLCHHTAFDGLILSYHYGIVPKFYFDTLSMSRPLLAHTTNLDLESLAQHLLGRKKRVDILELEGVSEPNNKQLEKLFYRATDDVDLTYEVFQKLLKDFPKEELEVIDSTIRMFTDPRIILDRERTKAILEEEINHREQLLEKLGLEPEDVRSPKKFAALLETAGIKAPTKISPITGKPIYAFAKTDSEFQALRSHESGEVRDLVEGRLAVKANQIEKRAERLLEVTENSDGKLSIPLKYCGAHTFRWSGFDSINPQNFGRSSPLRACLTARENKFLDIKDYAQIEARIVAWLAGQEDLVAAFADPERDPYAEFGTELFGEKITKKTHPQHRFIAKTIILGSGYGMGAKRLRESIKQLSIVELGQEMDVGEYKAQQYIHFYRKRYPKISDRYSHNGLWGKMHMALMHMCGDFDPFYIGPLKFEKGKVLMPNGLYLVYNGINFNGAEFTYLSKDFNNTRIGIYDGKLTENLVQSLARIVITQGMNKVKQRYPILLQVHDEIACEIPQKSAEEASTWITDQLEYVPEWAEGLPLEVEGGYGERYAK